VLESIETGKLGFTLLLEHNKLAGLISNADVRKALISNGTNTFSLSADIYMNASPVVLQHTATVNDMLKLIKSCPFPILYLPVVNDAGEAQGIVTFVNLIKGEI
jgi:ribulose-phosphate 3-epimerase